MQSQDIRRRKKRRRIMLGGGIIPAIRLSGSQSLAEESAEDTFIGTLSVVGVTGTPSFTLVDSSSNKAKKTGNNILAGSASVSFETLQSFVIVVSVSGVTPSIPNQSFTITVIDVVEDTTPNSFSFTDVTGAALSTIYESDIITISGVDGPSTVTVTGGEYSKNGGAWTSAAGSAVNDDTFAVRATSSGSYTTAVNVVLSVGGNVTSATTDTYTVTTLSSDAAFPTPTLALETASDSGVSNSDGITNDNTPSLTATFSALLEGDLIYMNDNGVAVNLDGVGYHTVTAGEAGGSSISLGMSALSDGVHSLQIKRVSGVDFSDWSSALPITVDTAAPTLSSASGAEATTSTASLSVSTNEASGTLYYVVTASVTKPTKTQIIAGQNDGGTSAYYGSSQSISSTGTKTATATGLTAGGTRYAHFVHVDAAGNGGDSDVVTSASWTQTGTALTSDEFVTRSGVTGTDETNYRALIDGLDADGVWSKLDCLYIFCAPDETTALRNLKSSSFTATKGGAPGFVAYDGYTGVDNSSTVYISTNFNASTAGGNFTQNSAHAGVWVNSALGGSGVARPALNLFTAGGASTDIFPRFTDGKAYYRINDSVAAQSAGITTANTNGYYVGVRTGASTQFGYKNASDQGVVATNSATINNGPQNLLGELRTPSTHTGGLAAQISAAHFGGALTSTDVSNLYSRIGTFRTAVGL